MTSAPIARLFFVFLLTLTTLSAPPIFASDTTCQLQTNSPRIDQAFAAANEVCRRNTQPYWKGLLKSTAPVLMAGSRYPQPWTRDGSINVWNGISLISPGVGKNTLLSVVNDRDGKMLVLGQAFDDIIWVPAAWSEYLYSGDKDFLKLAFQASQETLASLEPKLFDSELGLFRGPGVSCDVVSAYPDAYASGQHPLSDMHALSTNCAYYAAYVTLPLMAAQLGIAPDPLWSSKAKALKTNINQRFWNASRHTYKYLVDSGEGDNSQELLGLALAVIYNVPDKVETKAIFDHFQTCAFGSPCLWPAFARFTKAGGFGNHSGIVWPFMQGFWAEACIKAGRPDLFDAEFAKLTVISMQDGSMQDGSFFQSYDPISGKPSGGIAAVRPQGPMLTQARPNQSWSATAYIRMILMDIIGMKFDPAGVRFEPHLPDALTKISLKSLQYRKAILDINITRGQVEQTLVKIDGQPTTGDVLNGEVEGKHSVEIVVKK